MSDYLQFLSEGRGPVEPIIPLTEEEFREAMEGIFESDEELEAYMQEIDWTSTVQKYGGIIGDKAISGAHQSGMVHGAAATAIVAAAAAAAALIYKRFYSKAAKQCAGLPTGEKTNCMRKIKADAVKAKIQKFESFKSKCDQAKNPTGCNNKLMMKIKAEKSKLGEAAHQDSDDFISEMIQDIKADILEKNKIEG